MRIYRALRSVMVGLYSYYFFNVSNGNIVFLLMFHDGNNEILSMIFFYCKKKE